MRGTTLVVVFNTDPLGKEDLVPEFIKNPRKIF